MALGKPAFQTPKQLDARALQAWQQVVDNIRERLRVIEAGVTTNTAAIATGDASLSAATASLQRQIEELAAAIRMLQNAIADGGEDSVLFVTLTAGEAMDAGAPVWVSAPQQASRIDPDDPDQRSAFFGIAAESAGAAGDPVLIALPGATVSLPGSSFTPGRALYAQLGGVTHDPAGDALPVGVACDAETIGVGSGTVALVDPSGDAGDAYLPVTYLLAAAAISLAELFDQGTPLPADGDTWVYDAAIGKFRAGQAGGGILPVVTGEVPPVLVYNDDGSLVYTEIE